MRFSPILLLSVLAFSLPVFAGPVDINTADAKTLDANLVGVGPKSAEAIVVYRTKHGPFKSVDELKKVKGVGPKTIEKNRANLTLGAPVKVSAPASAVSR
jgi:competence protein ComEA